MKKTNINTNTTIMTKTYTFRDHLHGAILETCDLCKHLPSFKSIGWDSNKPAWADWNHFMCHSLRGESVINDKTTTPCFILSVILRWLTHLKKRKMNDKNTLIINLIFHL